MSRHHVVTGALLAAALFTLLSVFGWPQRVVGALWDARWDRTEEVAAALPGQVVRHRGALLEVIEQRDQETVALRLTSASALDPLVLWLSVLFVLGTAGVVLAVHARPAPRREAERAPPAPHLQCGFGGARAPLSEEEIARLYETGPAQSTGTPRASSPTPHAQSHESVGRTS